MKKILFILSLFLLVFSVTSADFETESIDSFIKSPSYNDLREIKNPTTRFCEETYLKAYMRRDFTEMENEICGDFFAKKMESEFLYKKKVLEERGIY